MKRIVLCIIAAVITLIGSVDGWSEVKINTGVENVEGVGKVKFVQSDPFTTQLDGEEVTMKILYSVVKKNQPTFSIIFMNPSNLVYQNVETYLNNLAGIYSQIKYTGARLADIYAKDKNYTWSTSQQHGVAGSVLAMVQKATEKVNGSDQICMMVVIPEGIMDSNRYNWNNKNHWKDFEKELISGNIPSLRYQFNYPGTSKQENLIIPLNDEMASVMRRLIEIYNAKK